VGQKIHPKGFRLGISEDWDAVWYAGKQEFGKYLIEDVGMRKYLKNTLYRAGIARIRISRRANQIQVDIYSARPGLIIGKGGKDIAVIRDELVKRYGKQITINILEEKNAEASAQLLAEGIASQLEKRVAHRRAMKQAISRGLRAHAKGVKVAVSGRLGGAEIARYEWYLVGRVPLHTLRAIIDYGTAEAMTIYGKIGIKVWVYKGDILIKKTNEGAVNSGAATS
jgi:small subunit ribosomal protein S3